MYNAVKFCACLFIFPRSKTLSTLMFIGTGVGLTAVTGLLYYFIQDKRKKKNYPKDVIILHLIPRIREAPNASPFAIKLETYLRMVKLPYQVEYTFQMSPKKKSPWITYNGKVVSDSQFIIEYLNKEFGRDLNSHLTNYEKAIATAMYKMMEDNFLWTAALSRWVYCASDPSLKKILPLSSFVIWRLKKDMESKTYHQGMGRHSRAEVESIGLKDLQTLSDYMGEKKYLMGDVPCEADCSIFGIVALLRQMPDTSFCTKAVNENTFPNLNSYFNRVKDEFWPDWFHENVKFPTTGLQPIRVPS